MSAKNIENKEDTADVKVTSVVADDDYSEDGISLFT